MIDPLNEELFLCSQAAQFFPRQRNKKPHSSYVHRLMTTGKNGIVLESVLTPGGRATSRKAIADFIAALTAQAGISAPAAPAPRSSKLRKRQIARAEASLAGRGY